MDEFDKTTQVFSHKDSRGYIYVLGEGKYVFHKKWLTKVEKEVKQKLNPGDIVTIYVPIIESSGWAKSMEKYHKHTAQIEKILDKGNLIKVQGVSEVFPISWIRNKKTSSAKEQMKEPIPPPLIRNKRAYLVLKRISKK